MIKENKASLQSNEQNPIDPTIIADIDYEKISIKTSPILHQSSRFIYVIDGNGKIKIDNNIFNIEKNCLISVVPWAITEIIEVNKPLKIYVLKYSFDLFNKNLFNIYDNESRTVLISKTVLNQAISYHEESLINTFKKAFELTRSQENIPKNIINSLFFSYILEIGASHALYFESKEEVDTKDKKNILSYIYNNSDKKITLDELSKIFFMSNSNISRYINSETNLTFFELLNEIRVKKAVELLIHTDMTVSEIASFLGYFDKSHFIKNFKSIINVNPNEFRRCYKGNNNYSDNVYSEIVNYIYNNSSTNITINEISEMFNTSPVQINKNLKILIGKTFNEFLNYVRINKAAKLILSTDESITNIAFEVGYNTVKTFYRNFIKIKNITPREFRNTISIDDIKEANDEKF